jgi:hypothetical protein
MISFKKFALWFILISIIVGGFLSFIKWGDHSGKHGLYGQGLPIPSVLWDNPPRHGGSFVDYPNPLAHLLNPLIVYFIGLCFFGIMKGTQKPLIVVANSRLRANS